MLLFAGSGIFGTFVDRNKRKTSMTLSNAVSLVCFSLAGVVYVVADDRLHSLGQLLTWVLILLVLAGAVAGNLRAVALSTTVTLLVPEDRRSTGPTGW
jgi:DHA3 family multidrug efflux protein-like MFS transporter